MPLPVTDGFGRRGAKALRAQRYFCMHNNIFWFGFKRNLTELYYLLYSEKFISCDEDEFLSHFTGKKFRVNEKSRGKVIWNGERYLLIVALNHLTDKGFLHISFDEVGIAFLSDHFASLLPGDIEKYERLKNSGRVKKLRSKLECMFPETSGLRCKQRLYYKTRNKESLSKVLGECGILDLTPQPPLLGEEGE